METLWGNNDQVYGKLITSGGSILFSTTSPASSGTWTSATLPTTGFDAWSGSIAGINFSGIYMILNQLAGNIVLFSTNSGSTWTRMAYDNGILYGDNLSITKTLKRNI